MFELLVGFVAVLWLSLAVVVNVHAKGHGRSGAFWFFVVLFTGIFGIIGYLLLITSSKNTEGGPSSKEIVSDVSDFAIMGVVAVFLFFFLASIGLGLGLSLLSAPVLVVLGRVANEKWDWIDGIQTRLES